MNHHQKRERGSTEKKKEKASVDYSCTLLFKEKVRIKGQLQAGGVEN